MVVAILIESSDGVAVVAATTPRESKLVEESTEQEEPMAEDLAAVGELEPLALVDEAEGPKTEVAAEAAAVVGRGSDHDGSL